MKHSTKANNTKLGDILIPSLNLTIIFMIICNSSTLHALSTGNHKSNTEIMRIKSLNQDAALYQSSFHDYSTAYKFAYIMNEESRSHSSSINTGQILWILSKLYPTYKCSKIILRGRTAIIINSLDISKMNKYQIRLVSSVFNNILMKYIHHNQQVSVLNIAYFCTRLHDVSSVPILKLAQEKDWNSTILKRIKFYISNLSQ